MNELPRGEIQMETADLFFYKNFFKKKRGKGAL